MTPEKYLKWLENRILYLNYLFSLCIFIVRVISVNLRIHCCPWYKNYVIYILVLADIEHLLYSALSYTAESGVKTKLIN
jgi:hypothetical protein